jgi:hypothetical protein
LDFPGLPRKFSFFLSSVPFFFFWTFRVYPVNFLSFFSVPFFFIKHLAEEIEEQNKDEVENLEKSIMDIESDSD